MEVHYTKHAQRRLAKRQLRQEWVERAVRFPMRIEPDNCDADLEHRLACLPELANRVLRVIVSKDEPRRVVTAYLDHTMKGKV